MEQPSWHHTNCKAGASIRTCADPGVSRGIIVHAILQIFAQATSPLPVPVSCWIKTVESLFFASEPANNPGQKPRPTFSLVNPVLDEAGSRHVIVALAYLMRTA
jgi:hypothetical protein